MNINDINKNTRLETIVNDQRFNGYGKFIFPIRNNNDLLLRLKDIDHLLPYHSHIHVNTTIEVVKAMYNKVKFYDIYSEEEKTLDPSKKNTGLFFFKGKANAPFAIINAGGGFVYVGSIHESFPHALELSKKGYNAFALHYRTNARLACEDLAKAITFIFEHAQELEVNVHNYSLWGGSAGARMAAYLGSYGTAGFGQKAYPKASTIIMQYTGHTDYTPDDPSTYAIVGKKDGIAYYRTMQKRLEKLNDLGIDTKFHLCPSLGHGFGLGIGTSAQGWLNEAVDFWEKHID